MSRPWILGIVCCSLMLAAASAVRGQEYLDLPEEPEAHRATLVDKWDLLKSRLSRRSSQSGNTSSAARNASSQASNSTAPRYRSAGQASPSQNNAAARLYQTPSRQPQVQSGVIARPRSDDLLPESKLFSRGTQPRPIAASQRESTESSENSSPDRVARKSPSVSRANELDAALADLLNPQPAPSAMEEHGKVFEATPSAAAKLSTLGGGTFDLREALRDDERDAIAEEVAEAVEDAQADTTPAQPAAKPKSVARAIQDAPKAEPRVKPQDQPAVVESKPAIQPQLEQATQPTTVPSIVDTAAQALAGNSAFPMVAPQAKAKVSSSSADELFTDQAIAKPSLAQQTTDKQTTAQKPAFQPQTSQPQPSRPVISIATPAKSSSFPKLVQQKVTNDPFETQAKQAFGGNLEPQAAPAAGNPMRSFSTTPEPVQVAPIARPERGVLQTMQQPVIISHVEGPRSILVGREATYQVTLENTSTNAASNLSAEITVPEWAELLDAMSTSGVVERANQTSSGSGLDWKLNELAGRSSQSLRIRLIPRSGRPLQLGVRWTQAPVQTQAVVEVKEPKLELAISGPQEVRFGKPQRYRLTLRNPGTGLTQQVALRLIPPGGDAQSASTQQIGDLKPGEVRDLDLELTAREAGELLIQADAVADGGLKANTTKTVMCLKPELEVDWRGPDKKYAGTVAAYYFRVRNPGTAATEPVQVSVKLPEGAEFVSASDGYSIDTTTGIVSWRLAAIDVNEEQFTQMRCKITRPGQNEFQVAALASDNELSDSKSFATEVVALADLKLQISDPQGPLPLGETVVYEIRVKNRGTTDAENVNIVGLFSEGIDPTTVEGAQYTARDGRVSFHPIASLPAGREVMLKIHAKANQVGTHIFRAEVTCPKLDIKLAAEETTRFFQDEHRWEEGQTPYSAERESSVSR